MTASEYRIERKKRGSQRQIAADLGVDYHTIQRRERGDVAVSKEAWFALLSLPIYPTDEQVEAASPPLSARAMEIAYKDDAVYDPDDGSVLIPASDWQY